MTHLNDLSKVYLENIAESAVPGKPAERLGAVTAIPKSEQDAARERILAKTKAKQEKMKEAVDQDQDGDNDFADIRIARMIASGVPKEVAIQKTKDKSYNKKSKKVTKEGFSNWRQDLSEVMTDTEDDKEIKEKKVNNKIKINPTLGEAVEEIGGTLLEMIEIEGVLDELNESELLLLSDSLIEEVVEEFFYECLDEGYEVEEVEDLLIESIETSFFLLNEAKVTLGHDTKIKSDRLEKVKSAVKKVGKAVARGAGYAAGLARRAGSAAKREFKAGYERGKGGSSSSSSTSQTASSSSSSSDSSDKPKRPGLLARIGSKLKSGLKKAVARGARAVSRGARNVARKMEGGETKKTEAPKAAPKKAEKPADPWEGSATTPPKAKAKKAAAPKAKAKAPAKKKKSGNLDNLLASIRNEETSVERIDRISREKVAQRAAAAKKDQESKASSAAAFQAHKKEVLAKGGRPVDALDSWQKKQMKKEEIEQIGEATAADRAKNAVADDRLSAEQEKTNASMDKLRAQSKRHEKSTSLARTQARIAAKKSEDTARAMHPKPGVSGRRIEDPKPTGSKPSGYRIEEVDQIDEKITAKTDMGTAIKDFYASKSPQLAGRTKEERRKAAIAAVLTARRGGRKLGEQMGTEPAEPVVDKKKEMMDKQKLANMKMLQQKQQMLQRQKLQMQKSGKLPLEAD